MSWVAARADIAAAVADGLMDDATYTAPGDTAVPVRARVSWRDEETGALCTTIQAITLDAASVPAPKRDGVIACTEGNFAVVALAQRTSMFVKVTVRPAP